MVYAEIGQVSTFALSLRRSKPQRYQN